MFKFRKLIPLFLIFLLASCSDDESDYKFKDQDLAGKIENEAWVYADGYSELIDNYLGSGDTYVDINLVLEHSEPGCDIVDLEGDMVFFAVPAEVGLYKLNFSLATFEGQVVTLYDDETGMNSFATEGAVQIISISNDLVTGRIDARCDKQNFVNGNFTVSICPD